MKQRMNILPPGPYFLYRSDLEQLAHLERNIADLGENIHAQPPLKFVPAMNTRTQQHLKRPAKAVLVYRGRPLEPKIDINVKTRRCIDRYRRIAKFCVQITLLWQPGLL